jgi:hypothetical protein
MDIFGSILQGCELFIDKLLHCSELIFQSCEEGMVNVIGSIVIVQLVFMEIELIFWLLVAF